ncbi:MAG: RNA polymerase sigma factor [Planctomycetota bacterium]
MTAPLDPQAHGQSREMDALLDRHRAELIRYIERAATSLLRFEAAEDLAQGISIRALSVAETFVYRSDEEFFGWLIALAKQHFAKRRAYWTALRRGGGIALRLSASDSQASNASGIDPVISQTGPSTVASRREQLSLAMRALEVLYPRDREIIQWLAEDVSVEEISNRLGTHYEAAKKARQRAVDRFRRTFEAVSRATN